MNVGVITNTFPLVSETFILRQITGLIDLGHDVTVVSETSPDPTHPVHDDVVRYRLLERTRYVNVPPSIQRLIRAPSVLRTCVRASPRATALALDVLSYRRRAIGLSNLYRLKTLLPNPWRFDVIHAHFGNVGDQFRFARRACGAGLVVTFHGFDFSLYPQAHGRDCYRGLFREADVVTVNSSFTDQRVQELGCPAAKIVKLPMSVDLEAFPCVEHAYRPGDTVSLLTVARLTEKKGLEYSIRGVAKAMFRFPALRYDIIGDGHLRSSLQHLIDELGVADAVTLYGGREADCVRKMMQAAHIFILASVTAKNGDQEGQGLALQEAQASGLPVLATEHGPFPESIIPGQTGVLVPERDADALAERLLDLLTHPMDWIEMGRRGRRYVEKTYDSKALNRRLVDVYTRALSFRAMDRR